MTVGRSFLCTYHVWCGCSSSVVTSGVGGWSRRVQMCRNPFGKRWILPWGSWGGTDTVNQGKTQSCCPALASTSPLGGWTVTCLWRLFEGGTGRFQLCTKAHLNAQIALSCIGPDPVITKRDASSLRISYGTSENTGGLHQQWHPGLHDLDVRSLHRLGVVCVKH